MSDRILRAPSIGAVGSVVDTLPPAVREALDEAYQRGLTEGYQRARGDLARHAQVLATKLETTDARLETAVVAAARRDADTVVDLAVALAQWFVGQIDLGDVVVLEAVVDDLLADAIVGGGYELAVHPDIAAVVVDQLPAAVSSVRGDPDLAPGELRLTADGLVIERVWHHAIDRVRHGLIADVTTRQGEGERG